MRIRLALALVLVLAAIIPAVAQLVDADVVRPGPGNTTITLDGDVTVTGSCTACGGPGSGTTRSVGITMDGAGSAIATGVKGFVYVPFAGTIVAATLLSTDASATACSLVIDVWKDSFATYPPTNADSITASAPPTLSSASSSQDVTLTGWTTTITAGDIVGFNVDSGDCTRATLVLTVEE